MKLIYLIFKDEHNNELISAALGTGTNLLREFSKIVTDDAEKYSVDLNSLYKKYEIPAKADQVKSYLQTQVTKWRNNLKYFISIIHLLEQINFGIEINRTSEIVNTFYII